MAGRRKNPDRTRRVDTASTTLSRTAQRGTPFGDYAASWLDQRNLKPRTRHEYSALIAGPLAKLAKVPLHLITPEVVRTWHTGLGTSTPTKNSHAYGLLHAVLNTAVSDGLIGSNPAAIRGAMNTATKRQAVILTPDEVAKVALAIQPVNLESPYSDQRMVWPALGRGHRIDPR